MWTRLGGFSLEEDTNGFGPAEHRNSNLFQCAERLGRRQRIHIPRAQDSSSPLPFGSGQDVGHRFSRQHTHPQESASGLDRSDFSDLDPAMSNLIIHWPSAFRHAGEATAPARGCSPAFRSYPSLHPVQAGVKTPAKQDGLSRLRSSKNPGEVVSDSFLLSQAISSLCRNQFSHLPQ